MALALILVLTVVLAMGDCNQGLEPSSLPEDDPYRIANFTSVELGPDDPLQIVGSAFLYIERRFDVTCVSAGFPVPNLVIYRETGEGRIFLRETRRGRELTYRYVMHEPTDAETNYTCEAWEMAPGAENYTSVERQLTLDLSNPPPRELYVTIHVTAWSPGSVRYQSYISPGRPVEVYVLKGHHVDISCGNDGYIETFQNMTLFKQTGDGKWLALKENPEFGFGYLSHEIIADENSAVRYVCRATYMGYYEFETAETFVLLILVQEYESMPSWYQFDIESPQLTGTYTNVTYNVLHEDSTYYIPRGHNVSIYCRSTATHAMTGVRIGICNNFNASVPLRMETDLVDDYVYATAELSVDNRSAWQQFYCCEVYENSPNVGNHEYTSKIKRFYLEVTEPGMGPLAITAFNFRGLFQHLSYIPRRTHQRSRVLIPSGHRFRITCRSSGQITPQLTLYHNGIAVNRTVSGAALFYRGSANNATEGNYRCVAWVSLRVHGQDMSIQLERHKTLVAAHDMGPPRGFMLYHITMFYVEIEENDDMWVRAPSYVERRRGSVRSFRVEEGQRFRLKCYVRGVPRPHLTLNRVTSTTEVSRLKRKLLSRHVVKLLRADAGSGGFYQCVARAPPNMFSHYPRRIDRILLNVTSAPGH